MEQLWYFLLRNGAAVVFLIEEWSSCGEQLWYLLLSKCQSVTGGHGMSRGGPPETMSRGGAP